MTFIDSRLAGAGLALFLCLSPTVASAQCACGGSFVDDFDTLDKKRWYVSDGWSNGDHQNCWWSADQVYASDGMLSVGFAPVPAGKRQYRCGEVQTRVNYSHGVFEARLKAPRGSGLDAAFFTYIGPNQKQQHDEIDFEILPKDLSRVHTTTFVNGKSGNGMEVTLPHPASEDFIDYAIDWRPDRVDFYLNGQLSRSITAPKEVPVTPQRIFFNLWGSDTLGDWMGRFEAPASQLLMQVEWVAYTAPGDACQFPESVVCSLNQRAASATPTGKPH